MNREELESKVENPDEPRVAKLLRDQVIPGLIEKRDNVRRNPKFNFVYTTYDAAGKIWDASSGVQEKSETALKDSQKALLAWSLAVVFAPSSIYAIIVTCKALNSWYRAAIEVKKLWKSVPQGEVDIVRSYRMMGSIDKVYLSQDEYDAAVRRLNTYVYLNVAERKQIAEALKLGRERPFTSEVKSAGWNGSPLARMAFNLASHSEKFDSKALNDLFDSPAPTEVKMFKTGSQPLLSASKLDESLNGIIKSISENEQVTVSIRENVLGLEAGFFEVLPQSPTGNELLVSFQEAVVSLENAARELSIATIACRDYQRLVASSR
ncbi:MAG: hypothetical protein ACTJGF_03975 [Corynebacterium sp.]|uniref:hypothetical protein n=1 Tax=Corynebacterium casei TaxID=160386 RepID=UPI003FD69796